MSSSTAKSKSLPELPELPSVSGTAPVVPATMEDDSWGELLGDVVPPAPSVPAPSVPAPSAPPALADHDPVEPAPLQRVSAEASNVVLKKAGAEPEPVAVEMTPPTGNVAPFRLWANRDDAPAPSSPSVPFFAPPGGTATDFARVEPPDTEPAPRPEDEVAEESEVAPGPVATTPTRELGLDEAPEPRSSTSGEIEIAAKGADAGQSEAQRERPRTSSSPVVSVGPRHSSRERHASRPALPAKEEKSKAPLLAGIGIVAAAGLFALLGGSGSDGSDGTAPAAARVDAAVIAADAAEAPAPEAPAAEVASPAVEPAAIRTAVEAEVEVPIEPTELEAEPSDAQPEALAEPESEVEPEPEPEPAPADAQTESADEAASDADALLVEAKAAFAEGRYREAKRLAKESNAAKPSLAARRLIASVACARGLADEARAAVAKLPKGAAARVAKECAKKGIDLEPKAAKDSKPVEPALAPTPKKPALMPDSGNAG